jgi:N-acetylmuramoyl-L-alanine amidase
MTDEIQVIIDSGHGGAETGAVSHGYVEKDLNLKTAKLIESKLKKYFKHLHMTRTEDIDMSLSKRGKFVADKAEQFDGKTICLSVHFNAYNGLARGVETIYSIFSKPDLATFILNAITKLGLPKRRVFKKKSSRGYFDWYAMHRLTGKAQTIIVEPLFLDNFDYRKLLAQDGFLDKLADAYVEGLLNYLGIEIQDDTQDEPKPSKILNLDEALKELVDNGVINSSDYWKKASSVVKYLDIFIINIANKLKG